MSIEMGSGMLGDALEQRLTRLYEVTIPGSVAGRIDSRVAAAIATKPHPGTTSWTRRRRLVAALVVAGIIATVAATPVIRFFESWGASFDRVFEMSTVIDQSVTVDGYRVSVVRAYGDPSKLLLGLTLEDLQDRGWAEINLGNTRVTDEAGRTYREVMATGNQPSPETSESWHRYEVPVDAAGIAEHRFTVQIDGISVRPSPAPTLANGEIDLDHISTVIPGSWTFEFDLGFFGARTAHPAVTAIVGDITVSFERLTVTPATTVGQLSFEGLPVVDPSWGWDPYIRIVRDGQPLDIWMLDPGFVQDTLTFEADRGFEDLSGTWVITIDEFHRDIPDPSSDITTESESLKGPWVLTFEGPPPVAP